MNNSEAGLQHPESFWADLPHDPEAEYEDEEEFMEKEPLAESRVKTQNASTPRSWRVDLGLGSDGAFYILSPNGELIAILDTDNSIRDQANAALICRAVNNFDALLKACKEMTEVAATCFRVIDTCGATAIDALEAGLKEFRIADGFGLRAQSAIAAAESKDESRN